MTWTKKQKLPALHQSGKVKNPDMPDVEQQNYTSTVLKYANLALPFPQLETDAKRVVPAINELYENRTIANPEAPADQDPLNTVQIAGTVYKIEGGGGGDYTAGAGIYFTGDNNSVINADAGRKSRARNLLTFRSNEHYSPDAVDWEDTGTTISGKPVYQSLGGTYQQAAGDSIGTYSISGARKFTVHLKQDVVDNRYSYVVLGRPNTPIDLATSDYEISYKGEDISDYTSYEYNFSDNLDNTIQVMFHKERPPFPIGVTLDLNNGQWRDTGTTVEGNKVYESDVGSWHINNGESVCTIYINGVTSISINVSQSSEYYYDYCYIGNLDEPVSKSNYRNTTRGVGAGYVTFTYNCSPEQHFIQLMYAKDGGDYEGEDRGYFYYVINSMDDSQEVDDIPVADGDSSTDRAWIYGESSNPYLGEHGEVFNDYDNNYAIGDYAHAEGNGTIASGDYSHAEGLSTKALKYGAHVEGDSATASGENSHAEGESSIASAEASHAEGHQTQAIDKFTHAEGYMNIASAQCAHAEGNNTIASGENSHTEGKQTRATNIRAHAEGGYTLASGGASHAEGNYTVASGSCAHAEGYGDENTHHNVASGTGSHAEGYYTLASEAGAHAEGYGDYHNNTPTTASGIGSHAEGYRTKASASFSHAEGYNSSAEGQNSHAEGGFTQATADFAHAEGRFTIASGLGAHAEGYGGYGGQYNTATGIASHTEGSGNLVSGNCGHAEGTRNTVYGESGHADGSGNKVYGHESHAEGSGNTVASYSGHIEGAGNKNTARNAHVEGAGNKNIIKAEGSHTEGGGNTNYGSQAHIEGGGNAVSGQEAHVEGGGNKVHGPKNHGEGGGNTAYGLGSHVEGKHNVAIGYSQHAEGAENKIGVTEEPDYFSYGTTYAENKIVAVNDLYRDNGHYSGTLEPTTPFLYKCKTEPGQIQETTGVQIVTASEWNSSTTYQAGSVVKVSGIGLFTNSSESTGDNPAIQNSSGNPSGSWRRIDTVLSPFYSRTPSVKTYYLLDCDDGLISSKVAIVDANITVDAMWEPVTTPQTCHVEGYNNITLGDYQHVQGKFNVADNTKAFIIGNGTATDARSNALTVDWSGNTTIAGDLTTGTTLNTTAQTVGAAINEISVRVPAPPTTDGNYILSLTVVDGIPTYTWVST